MKTKSGTAISTSLVMTPKMRWGIAPKKVFGSKTPKAKPSMPKISAVPASVKATGKPDSSTAQTVMNIRMSRVSAMAQCPPAVARPALWRSPAITRAERKASERP